MMEIRVARAVIQLFREEDMHLPAFSAREWERTFYWLDVSGMAIYLLKRLCALGIQDQVPAEVYRHLERNYTNNLARTQHLSEEFVLLNTSLHELGVRYANLKGFTLFPAAVANPSARYQSDLDVLIPYREIFRVSEMLQQRGYVVTHAGNSTWEFKANAGTLPAHEDMYKPMPQRSVEVHLLPKMQLDNPSGDLLDRVQIQQWNGTTFPALSEADKFIALAQHLFRHMRGEWTRLSWVIEFKCFLESHKGNAQLWRSVYAAASSTQEAATAIGASMLMTQILFGECTPPGMEWAAGTLPSSVRIWIERYAEAVLLADFPGTKLYLLLETALAESASEAKSLRRKRLFPMHLAPPVVQSSSANDSWGARFTKARTQLRYNVFRLRFHLVQGVRYLFEAQRWKRLTARVEATS